MSTKDLPSIFVEESAAVDTALQGIVSQPAQEAAAPGQDDSVPPKLPPPLVGTITPIEFVGWGGYSEVYRGVLTRDGQDISVGIKYIKPRNPRGGGQLAPERFETRIKRETVLWQRAQHENILRFIGYQINQGIAMLVSPWCERGNLNVYIEKHPELTECDKLKLLCDAARGLQHLHSLNPPIVHGDIKPDNVLIHSLDPPIVHGDIKPDNVLITSTIRAALADFGVSRLMVELGVRTGLTTAGGAGGPAGYQAIELMQADNVQPTDKSDVFSFGGLILATMTGKGPFWKIRTEAVIVTSIVRGITPSPEDHEVLSSNDSLWDLMGRCWNPRPSQRPCMEEIINELKAEIERRGGSGSGDA